MTGESFYVTGGTLRPDAPSYVERQADKEFCEGLLRGEFCYVLTARQMGKSSLMVRAVKRLRQERAKVAVLDLTAIGQNLSPDQWYDGLLLRLGQQLDLEDELEEFCRRQSALGPLQRWLTALESVVLPSTPERLIICIDEIDVVRSLPFSTDEFFAAIRECYNRRSREPVFARLAFGLLGVATPTDLIRDPRMTPFNIGRRIELKDFGRTEAAPLARGLGTDSSSASRLLDRVLYWTGGHPYLTQRLCLALYEALRPPTTDGGKTAVPPLVPTLGIVDRLADRLFLSRQAQDRDDNLIFVRERLLRSEVDVAGLLLLYRRIHGGQQVPDDETNPLVSVLRLSGITRGADGVLEVRNRIYTQVFDGRWIQSSLPEAEVRRQRRASRRGVLIGFGAALVLLLAYLVFGPVMRHYKNTRAAYGTAEQIVSAYRHLHGYQDRFASTIKLGLGGSMVVTHGGGSIAFEKPNIFTLHLKASLHQPPLELRLFRDQSNLCVYVPSTRKFRTSPSSTRLFDLPASLQSALGPERVLPLYRMFLGPAGSERFYLHARNLQFVRDAELNGRPVRLLNWDYDAETFFSGMGLTNLVEKRRWLPFKAWVDRSSGFIQQLEVDLSPWAKDLIVNSSPLPVSTLTITETHRSVASVPVAAFNGQLGFTPGPEDHVSPSLDLNAPDLVTLASRERRFLRLIPSRLEQTPRSLIDLSDYYNAALVQPWHDPSGANRYTLEALSPGLLQLDGTVFDVRGIVQISGTELEKIGARYPQQITGIRIGQPCRELSFLHATGWHERDGTQVGSYVVHFSDGQELSIPLVYGDDLRDWMMAADAAAKLKRAKLVWSASPSKEFRPVRLFKMTWVNPQPLVEIASIDFVSTMSASAPFLIALTAE